MIGQLPTKPEWVSAEQAKEFGMYPCMQCLCSGYRTRLCPCWRLDQKWDHKNCRACEGTLLQAFDIKNPENFPCKECAGVGYLDKYGKPWIGLQEAMNGNPIL